MAELEVITTREFIRNYSKINIPVKVYDRNKPRGVYFPYDVYEKMLKTKQQKFSLKDLDEFVFSGDKNLSKNIDSLYK
jgi:hypothetical protein